MAAVFDAYLLNNKKQQSAQCSACSEFQLEHRFSSWPLPECCPHVPHLDRARAGIGNGSTERLISGFRLKLNHFEIQLVGQLIRGPTDASKLVFG
jgi:hypothetical protein